MRHDSMPSALQSPTIVNTQQFPLVARAPEKEDFTLGKGRNLPVRLSLISPRLGCWDSRVYALNSLPLLQLEAGFESFEHPHAPAR